MAREVTKQTDPSSEDGTAIDTSNASKTPAKSTAWLSSESSESDNEPRTQKRPKWGQFLRKCYRCAAPLADGHNQVCPLKLCCGKCGRSGHESSVCWRPNQHSLVYDSKTCQICKRHGHVSQNCIGLNKPLEINSAVFAGISCLRCGEKGHLNCGRTVPKPPNLKPVETDSDDEDDMWGKRSSNKRNH